MALKNAKASVAAQLLLSLASAQSLNQSSVCKAVPASSNWPDQASWAALNETLDGGLLAPLPPAIVCDQQREQFDAASCAAVNSQWTNSSFHRNDPVSVNWPNWQDDACLPPLLTNNESLPCFPEEFPFYVVNASSPDRVVEAVRFASERDVRLSVKGTGHDFLGRSTGEGLSIWTRYLQGIEFIDYQTACSYSSSTPAVRIAAGHTWTEVYAEAVARNSFVVGGSDPNVGIGGYLTGGGHSPISGEFGLGADNVLELEVVTPSGEIVTANSCQNQELFWAMRGGGPQFGVLLSATVRQVPLMPATSFYLNITSTDTEASQNNNTNFYDVMTLFHQQLPEISRAGLMGYYFLLSSSFLELFLSGQSSDLATPSGSQEMTMLFTGRLLNGSAEDVDRAFLPISERSDTLDGVNFNLSTSPEESYGQSLLATLPGAVGSNAMLASRLLDDEALSDPERLVNALRVFESSIWRGHVVIGNGAHSFDRDSIAANPAWRTSWVHVVAGDGTYIPRNETDRLYQTDRVTNFYGQALRDLSPDTGCYPNEADVNEPNFGLAFWGDHYDRLLSFKREIDPAGVFWCNACVGSEDWVLNEDGSLCRI